MTDETRKRQGGCPCAPRKLPGGRGPRLGFCSHKEQDKMNKWKLPIDPLILSQPMAAHSSTLAWKIPWMEEPGRLQSMGSRRARHN